MTDEDFAALVTLAGPVDDQIVEILALGSEGTLWAARLEAVDVIIVNLEEEEVIGFYTIIDGPEDSIALPAYRAMMAANALWRSTGGLRFALVDDGRIEISLTLAAVNLSPRILANAILALADHTANWALFFSGAVPAPQSGPIAPAFDPSMIRL